MGWVTGAVGGGGLRTESRTCSGSRREAAGGAIIMIICDSNCLKSENRFILCS